MIEDGIADLCKAVLGAAIQGIPYDTTLPEGTALPAMTYQVPGGQSWAGLTTSGPQRLRVQFDIFTADGRTGRVIRQQLVAGLNGFSGVLSDGTQVDSVLFIQPIDGFENTARQFRRAAEFYFNFTFN